MQVQEPEVTQVNPGTSRNCYVIRDLSPYIFPDGLDLKEEKIYAESSNFT